ncbi:MAG: hypothetical protein NTV06_01855 [candidate division Zixibacteria bacterium]|nr:hypothetical protein [candidate division Zixibacteria bacterium]
MHLRQRVARFKGTLSDVRYYLTDHLGSVLGLVRHDGTIVNEVQYHPYSEILRRNNTDPVMRHGTGTWKHARNLHPRRIVWTTRVTDLH